MNHPKLLIVDDDTDVCRQMQWALASDYAVFLAHGRTSALHVCKVEQPAVVTLDLGLPSDPGGLEEGLQTLLPRPRAGCFYRKTSCPRSLSRSRIKYGTRLDTGAGIQSPGTPLLPLLWE